MRCAVTESDARLFRDVGDVNAADSPNGSPQCLRMMAPVFFYAELAVLKRRMKNEPRLRCA